MKKRVNSREFKLLVVREVENGEKRPAQARREHNLATSVLDRWRKEYAQRGEAAFTEKEVSENEALERKVADLERFCGQLAMGNAVLKKHYARSDRGATYRDHTSPSTDASALDQPADVELLQVSRSWYYEKQIRPAAAEDDLELRDAIEQIILEFAGYGYRRVTHALRRAGWRVNQKRVLRGMRGSCGKGRCCAS